MQDNAKPSYQELLEENRRLKNQLFEIKNEYDFIVNSNKIAVVRLDKDFKIKGFNKSAEKIFGFDKEEVIGRKVSESILPYSDTEGNDYSGFETEVFENFSGFEVKENENVRKDGSRIWMRWNNFAKYDNDGNVNEIISIGSDITEHYNTVSQLKRSENFYKALFEGSPNGVILLDFRGNFTEFNSNAHNKLGYTAEEFKKLDIDSIDASLTPEEIEEYFTKIINLKSLDFETVHKTKSGELRNINILATLLEIEGEKYVQCILLDITEKKNFIKEVTLFKHTLEAIFDSSNESHFIIDKDYKVLAFNRISSIFVKKMSGSELKAGDDFIQYGDPKTIEDFKKNFSKALAGESIEVIKKLKFPAGKFCFRVKYMPVLNENDEIYAVAFTATDITETKNAELQIRESEKKYRLIVENSVFGIAIADLSGKLLSVNPGFCKILGYSREEFLTMNIADYSDSTDMEKNQRYIEQIKSGEINSFTMEKRYIRKNGESVWVELAVSALKSDMDELEGFIGFVADISTRKMAEMKLKESETKYRFLYENINDLICLHNLDGTYLEVSPSSKKMIGYAPEELIGKNPYNYFHQEDLERIQIESHDKALESKQVRIQYRFRCAKGDFIWLDTISDSIKGEEGEVKYLMTSSRDITENVNAKLALEESEKKFRLIFKNSVFGIATTDTEGNIFDANPAFCKMLGYSKNELQKMSYIDITVTRFLEKEFELLEKLNKGVINSFSLEKKYLTKKGKELWIELATSTLIDENENTAGYLSIVADIDDRKKAEEEILKLSTAVTQSPAAIIITDLRGKIKYANPKFTKITGYDFEEVVNKSPRILKSGEHSSRFYKKLWSTISSGDVWRGNFLNKKKNGELFWESATIAPIKNENNKIINYVAVKQDITEKKLAEERLKDAMNKLEISLEGGNIAWWIWDYETGNVEYDARRAEMAGYTKEEFPDNVYKIMELVHPEDYEQTMEAMRKHINGETNEYFIDYRLRTKDGKWMWYFDRGKIIDRKEDGTPVTISGAVIDITDRKKLEQNFRELNATKDKFFSIIAHDLKNPFNVLINYSEKLSKHYQDLKNDDIKALSDTINSSAVSVAKLLENLLQWSRIQTGRIEIKKDEYDLYELVFNNIFLLKNNASEKGINLITHVKPETYAYFDFNMINTVIRNLLSNAIKFTPPGGQVEIISRPKNQDKLEVVIKDTGVGIKKENIRKLFKIDAKYSTRGTANEEGSGIGLLLCQEFIKLHDSELLIDSYESKGTKVMFELELEKK